MRRSRLVLSVLAGMLLVSCATPRHRGSVFVFAKAKDAVKLDPADIIDGESATVTNNIFESLVQFAPESTEIVPALATHWEITPDGKTYTFHLRPNVRFHDGTPCDADAIVFNYQRQMDPQSPYRFTAHFEYWANFFKAVDSVKAAGKDTVVMHLSAPDATFMTNMALFTMGIASPKAIKDFGQDVGLHPVGTGPFSFATWVRGEKIVLRANPDYWGTKPSFDKLIFKPVPDNGARLLELESGEIQGMDGINPDDVPKIEANPKLTMLKQPGMTIGYMSLNNSRPPFNNIKVRQAVAYALNKPALVKAFFAEGKLGQAAINPMPPTIWGYNFGLKPIVQDPEHARTLLREAGYPNGLDVVLWAMPMARPYMPQPQRIAEAIQSDLKTVGIRVSIRTYDWGIYLDKLGKGEHEAALMGWIGDNGDPDNFLYTMLDKDNANPPAASNNCLYKGEAMHQLLLAAKKTTDKAKRTTLYEQVQVIAQQEMPLIPLFHSMQIIAFQKGVENFHQNPTGMKLFHTVTLPKQAAK